MGERDPLMHAIPEIIAGVRGAENGSVQIFKRATTLYATIYPDFEGSSSSVPVAALTLDANGARVAFVNELVDVLVYASTGALLKQFGAGCAAPDVEVRSLSFTGTNYTGGAAAPGLPSSVQAIFDAVLASFGSTDWMVDWGAGPVPIYFAMSAIGGMFFNVKNLTYGAAGDGVTDDFASIQAAINAAVGGGIVFFPPGTYRTTQAFTVGAKVSLMGCGPAASVLQIDHATADLLTYGNASGTDWQFIRSMKLAAKQANTGSHVKVNANVILRLTLDECVVGDANTNGKGIDGAVGTGAIIKMQGGTIQVGGAAANHIYCSAAYPMCFGTRFVPPATFNSSYVIATHGGTFVGCCFENVSIGAGTFDVLDLDATAPSRGAFVIGCDIANPTAGTCVALRTTTADCLFESANRIGGLCANILVTGNAGTANTQGAVMGSRQSKREFIASDAGIGINCRAYGISCVSRTSNANQTLTLQSPPFVGAEFTLEYVNNNVGGIGTVTLSGSTPKGLASFAINATSVSYYFLRAVDSGSNTYWALVGSQVNQTI